ncbi:MAG TPA: hypothetical protein VK620_12095, partial [Bradyrhizobium sp.]|nr:hypothetical protein [Bradyrhizobium sp.]
DPDTPLCGTGCESSRIDLGQVARNIFRKIRKKDSTALSTNRPTGKSLEPVLLSARSIFALTEAAKLQ